MKKKILFGTGFVFFALVVFINVTISLNPDKTGNSSLFSLNFANNASAEDPYGPPTDTWWERNFLERWWIDGNTNTTFPQSSYYFKTAVISVSCPVYNPNGTQYYNDGTIGFRYDVETRYVNACVQTGINNGNCTYEEAMINPCTL